MRTTEGLREPSRLPDWTSALATCFGVVTAEICDERPRQTARSVDLQNVAREIGTVAYRD